MVRSMLSRWALGLLLASAAASALLGVLSVETASVLALVGSGFLSVGVFFPRTRMYAEWQSRIREDAVALTFDDGPHPETTPRVLFALAEHGQRATFFVIGWKVEAYPELAREIVRQGHSIGIHSFDHPWLYPFKTRQQVLADIRRSQDAVHRVTGVLPTLFRPPFGLVSPLTAEAARDARVTLVGWSLRAFEGVSWRQPEQVRRIFERRLRATDIVLLHDAAEAEGFTPAGVEALPAILDIMRVRGLRSVPLSSQDFAEQPLAELRSSVM